MTFHETIRLAPTVKTSRLFGLTKAWSKFSLLLNAILSPIIMIVLFFLVVTPLALLMRLFKQTPLKLDFDPEVRSYWIVRQPPGPEAQTMKNQF